MPEFAQTRLEQANAGQWTLMQDVFTVPPEAYAATFKLRVADQVEGEALAVRGAFAGIVPKGWKKGAPVPDDTVNLIPNPDFRRGHFLPAKWSVIVGVNREAESPGYMVPADTPPVPQVDGIRIEGSTVVLYVDRLPVQPGQRLLCSLSVKSTNPHPKSVALWPEWQKLKPRDWNIIRIRNPKKLSVDHLPAERVNVGDIGNYKPVVAKLDGDELLLVCYSGNVKGHPTLLYRSRDAGRTWTGPDKPDFAAGGEPYPIRLHDGTLLLTGGPWGNRSQDAGHSWTKHVPPEFDGRPAIQSNARNILQLNDGSLLQIVDIPTSPGKRHQRGNDYIARSTDSGATWPEVYPAQVQGVPVDYPYSIFAEAYLWQAGSGKLYAIARLDYRFYPLPNRQFTPHELDSIACGLVHYNHWPMRDLAADEYTYFDELDRLKLFTSTDLGRTWQPGADLGDYAYMYPSILLLADGRLLFTFTVRCIDPPLGVRAVLGTEHEDGFDFDFQNDMIMVDTQSPIGRCSAGGFGPTVQLDDGTLVTSYGYWPEEDKRQAGDWRPPSPSRCAVVRWRLPDAQ